MKDLTLKRSFTGVSLAVILLTLMSLAGCDESTHHAPPPKHPTPTVTATATRTPTVTPTPTRTPTVTPTATPTPVPVNACLPSSSLSVLIQGANVDAYVPNGSWLETQNLNVQLVPVEGNHARATIATRNAVNSCSSNSTTGETVCTANNTDVYLINGSALTKTLTSGATGTANFSGGPCQNCGVIVDASTNTAWMTIGTTVGSAYQSLDLASNTFAGPIASATGVSEDIAIDPNRHLILSPNEAGTYEILQTKPTISLFENPTGTRFLDSAAEDCTTGIALSSVEFTGELFIADLTQATFTPGSPGSWVAPSQFQVFPEFVRIPSGTTGIAIAPNTHLGVVSGEFGGNGFGVIQLPPKSGIGVPSVTDWAGALMPNDPAGKFFTMGLDPHTVTAYVSPNSAKAFAVIADDPRTFLAVVDLQALLAAPRTPGTHFVDPSVNLVATGIVTFVSVF